MTNSSKKTPSKKVGELRIRAQVCNGVETGKFFLDIPAKLMPTGKRKRKLFDSQRKALELARRIKKDIDYQVLGFAKQTKSPSCLFQDAVVEWCENEQKKVDEGEKKLSSFKLDKYRLKVLALFFSGYYLDSIDEKMIKKYKKERLNGRLTLSKTIKGKLSHNTVDSDLRMLRKLLRWAHAKEKIEQVPKIIMYNKKRKRVQLPTVAEIHKILSQLPEQAFLVVWFVAETGCRTGEAFNLIWDQVDLEEGLVEIVEREDWSPKTEDSERQLHLSPGLLDRMRCLPKRGRYVFHHRSDPNKPRTCFKKSLKSAVKRAGITRNDKPLRVIPKNFRKAFATYQAEQGTLECVLQELMGHSPGSKVTSKYYVYPTDESLKNAAATMQFQPKRELKVLYDIEKD